jgi:hypothetical protein
MGALSHCEGGFALLRVVTALPYISGRFISHSSFPLRAQFREVCILVYYEIRIIRLQLRGARSEGFRQKRWVSQTVCFQVYGEVLEFV